MKKKVVLITLLIIGILVSSIVVLAANDIVKLEVNVGQFKIFMNGTMQAEENNNWYYNEELEEFLPVTMVYKDKIYVPIDLLNNNLEYTYIQKENTIYFTTIKSWKEELNDKQNLLEQAKIEQNDTGADPKDIDPNKDITIKQGEIKFEPEDFGFSRLSSFIVGTDTISQLYSYYSRWVKNGSTLNRYEKIANFYDVDDKGTYHKWDANVIYDSNSKIVKDITFLEWEKQEGNAEFRTARDITTGSTIADVIKKYGKTYNKTSLQNGESVLTVLNYKFYADSEEMGRYIKGTLSFYTFPGSKLEESKVMGIRLKID